MEWGHPALKKKKSFLLFYVYIYIIIVWFLEKAIKWKVKNIYYLHLNFKKLPLRLIM